jgi:ADP-heptose:LPS heptosyltransferase
VILVLRALGIGDLAAAVPALRGIRAAFPGETLALGAPAWLTPLIELIGGVDRIIPMTGLTGPIQVPGPPRLAVNLHGSGPESHRLLQRTRPGELWAYANPAAGHRDGPSWSADDHEVQRWTRLLTYYGTSADSGDLALAVPRGPAPHGLTVLHPGAKSGSRRWPVTRYAQVARALAERGHRVVVTGSPDDTEAAARIVQDAGLPAGASLAGSTGVGELAALVAHARLVISGDTGVAHLATAYGTASVVLFGPMSPQRWGPPPGRPYHRAIWHGHTAEPGDAPGADAHPALLSISVDEVLHAVAKVEQARGGGPFDGFRAGKTPEHAN